MNDNPPPRRKGGRPARADAQKLQLAILDAAEDIFLEHGFSNGAIDTIAAKAGTSKQTIYARFGSKEALFIAVSNRMLAPRFDHIFVSDRPLRDALIHVAEQILTAMLDSKMVRMHSIIMAEAVRFPQLAKLSDEDQHFPGRAALLTVLDRDPMTSPISTTDKHRMMLMLQDMILAGPLRSAGLGLHIPPLEEQREHAKMAVDIFLGGVQSAFPATATQ